MPRKRKLPLGLWKRGDTYYAKFSHGGRTVRKRLSSDYDVACEALNSIRARADRGDFDLIDNDYKWEELKAEFLRRVSLEFTHGFLLRPDPSCYRGETQLRR
jgi:hypothetical protein